MTDKIEKILNEENSVSANAEVTVGYQGLPYKLYVWKSIHRNYKNIGTADH